MKTMPVLVLGSLFVVVVALVVYDLKFNHHPNQVIESNTSNDKITPSDSESSENDQNATPSLKAPENKNHQPQSTKESSDPLPVAESIQTKEDAPDCSPDLDSRYQCREVD